MITDKYLTHPVYNVIMDSSLKLITYETYMWYDHLQYNNIWYMKIGVIVWNLE